MFTVSDIKQFIYCPRVVYFTYVMPMRKKTTFKMDSGKDEHLKVESLEDRRQLRIYGFNEGERQFRLYLKSERLRLSGILDMLIISGGRFYPVDFKDSTNPPDSNHKYQLTGYALLVEEEFGKPVQRGFIHLIPLKAVYTIEITQNMRDFTKKVISRIIKMIEKEQMPPPLRSVSRCVDCEFKNWCQDVT